MELLSALRVGPFSGGGGAAERFSGDDLLLLRLRAVQVLSFGRGRRFSFGRGRLRLLFSGGLSGGFLLRHVYRTVQAGESRDEL